MSLEGLAMLLSPAARAVLIVVSSLTLVGVAACTSTLPPDTDRAMSSALSDRGVDAPDTVCDRSGPVQLGDMTRCTVNVDGQQLDVTGRVTDVDDGVPTFDIVSTGRPLSAAELAKRISEDSEDPTTCDGDLAPRAGATAMCTATNGGRDIPLMVTATDVTPDGVIHYSYR